MAIAPWSWNDHYTYPTKDKDAINNFTELEREEYQKAIADFNYAIKFSNNKNEKAQYYDWLAKAYYKKGDLKRYRENLEEAAYLYQELSKSLYLKSRGVGRDLTWERPKY